MSKFKKKKGNTSQEVNTASLPDIVFMLLFFFMVVTVMRDASLQVKVVTPSATELTKLEEKSLVNYLYVGRAEPQYVKLYGTRPLLQLGDKVSSVDDIPLFLEQHKQKLPEKKRGLITSSLRIDRGVTMGIVQDIKTKLRKSGQLRINYSAKKKAN